MQLADRLFQLAEHRHIMEVLGGGQHGGLMLLRLQQNPVKG